MRLQDSPSLIYCAVAEFQLITRRLNMHKKMNNSKVSFLFFSSFGLFYVVEPKTYKLAWLFFTIVTKWY